MARTRAITSLTSLIFDGKPQLYRGMLIRAEPIEKEAGGGFNLQVMPSRPKGDPSAWGASVRTKAIARKAIESLREGELDFSSIREGGPAYDPWQQLSGPEETGREEEQRAIMARFLRS